MGKKIFISYSHKQGGWVWGDLVPCLKASGAEVLIDRERFEAGQDLFKQMDSTQDQADSHVLVFSYVDLRNEKDAAQWDKLLSKCGVNLGISASDWLAARNTIVRYLNRGESVNLVVFNKPKWLELVKHIQKDYFPDLGFVDLNVRNKWNFSHSG